MNDFIPAILSGGAGTRLWPISLESSPKPFIKLPDGQSLLEKTYHRALSLGGVAEVLTVTNRDYYFRCKDEFELTGNTLTQGNRIEGDAVTHNVTNTYLHSEPPRDRGHWPGRHHGG